jgi:predicted RNase H-like HicB family nuclease
MRYAIVIERGEHNYSAYVPDLPGCVATAGSLAEVREDIRAAVEFHVEGLRDDGLPIPEPTTLCEYVDALLA